MFVGSCIVESDAGLETISGVIEAHELDFSKFVTPGITNSAKMAITALMLSGGREIGRNEETCQTFFMFGDYMIAVDDLGNLKASKPTATWNECIDNILYDYEQDHKKAYYHENEN